MLNRSELACGGYKISDLIELLTLSQRHVRATSHNRSRLGSIHRHSYSLHYLRFLTWLSYTIPPSTMNDNLESLLFLLRLPYFILSRLFRPSKPPPPKSSIQTREAALKRIETYEPTPLPRIRPRTLTIEDLHRSNESAFPSSEAVGEAQPSNPPFFRLPPEVRQMIYTEVLGGQTLHIIRKRNRLGFLKCRAPRREACPTKSCLGSVDGDGVWTRGVSGKEKTDGGLLDLALVSRRV